MPSNALARIPSRVKDLEELLIAHKLMGKGRKWAHGTGAINRAAILLLTSHLEGFVEDLFAETFEKIFPGRRAMRFLKQFNTPTCRNIDDLYEFLGIEQITHRVSFTPVSNKKVREAIDSLVALRHRIVHGQLTRSYVADVRSWLGYLRGISHRMDAIVSDELLRVLGSRPW